MQVLGYSQRTGAAPAQSLLEQFNWLEKLPIAILSGLLLGLSSAPYGIWWLAWVSVAPLLLLIYGARGKGEAALMGLAYGLAYHMLALRWMFDLHPMHWFVANDFMSFLVAFQMWFLESLHQAVLMCLFALFVHSLPMRAGFTPHYKRPFLPVHLSVALIWVFLQWSVAPSPIFLGVPIDQVAYGQFKEPAVIQMASLGGAQLIEFVILLFNSALACFLIEFTNISPRFQSRTDLLSDKVGAVFDVGFVLVLAWVLMQWGQSEVRAAAALPQYFQNVSHIEQSAVDGGAVPNTKPTGANQRNAAPKTTAAILSAQQKSSYAPPVPVAVVQGDIATIDGRKLTGTQISERYMNLSKNSGASLLVFPAAVVGGENRGAEPLAANLAKLAKDQKKDVLLGANESTSDGVAETVRLFSPVPSKSDTYIKYRLVPFVDYSPLGLFGTLLTGGISDKVTGGRPRVVNTYLPTLTSIWGKVGTSIDAEVVYPDLTVTQVNRGASLLVNVSDLSYFHKSSLGQEFIAAAALRAVENGRYFVLASNNGGSAVIDPHGIVTSRSLPAQSGVLLDRVQFLHGRTPFTRMCLWTPLYH